MVAMKKDILWVKWAPNDCNWYWKKLLRIKEVFKQPMSDLLGTAGREYKVSKGYLWFLGDQVHQPWSTIVWSKAITPRHTFTTWLFFHQRLPLKTESITSGITSQHGGLFQTPPIFSTLRTLNCPKGFKNITYAVAAATIYHIWNTRNHSIFKGKIIPATVVYHQTRDHIIQ
ncbi:hypothetical protein Cgig2_021844 [Carnegiea gigantea]|uniref:Reverse transcriptase zinc-binding domain-containing protein n=1 Tax=Carnegiea gigantea TaxID=171969 RepID=A0A9Q1Q4R4_9CARY|nr:hypothetical protein Cgig2_021844 [Carnegiea gigantea]